MDLSLAAARAHGADVIIANDPDADRSSAGIPTADDWRMLSGDEVGSLLGWWIAERARQDNRELTGAYAESIVSGTLLGRIAEDAAWSTPPPSPGSSGSPRCPTSSSATRRHWATASTRRL